MEIKYPHENPYHDDELVTTYFSAEDSATQHEGTLFPDNQVIMEDGTTFFLDNDTAAEVRTDHAKRLAEKDYANMSPTAASYWKLRHRELDSQVPKISNDFLDNDKPVDGYSDLDLDTETDGDGE